MAENDYTIVSDMKEKQPEFVTVDDSVMEDKPSNETEKLQNEKEKINHQSENDDKLIKQLEEISDVGETKHENLNEISMRTKNNSEIEKTEISTTKSEKDGKVEKKDSAHEPKESHIEETSSNMIMDKPKENDDRTEESVFLPDEENSQSLTMDEFEPKSNENKTDKSILLLEKEKTFQKLKMDQLRGDDQKTEESILLSDNEETSEKLIMDMSKENESILLSDNEETSEKVEMDKSKENENESILLSVHEETSEKLLMDKSKESENEIDESILLSDNESNERNCRNPSKEDESKSGPSNTDAEKDSQLHVPAHILLSDSDDDSKTDCKNLETDSKSDDIVITEVPSTETTVIDITDFRKPMEKFPKLDSINEKIGKINEGDLIKEAKDCNEMETDEIVKSENHVNVENKVSADDDIITLDTGEVPFLSAVTSLAKITVDYDSTNI